MVYREVMAVCSQIHIKHVITLCEQNAELLNVKRTVSLGCKVLNLCHINQSVRALWTNNGCLF